MTIDFYRTSIEERIYFHTDIGLESIQKRFFKKTPEALFQTLVSTPQKLEDILYRQAIFNDFITYQNINTLITAKETLKELGKKHNSTVKYWETVRDRGYEEQIPFIYDHTKLEEIVKQFTSTSEHIVTTLSEIKSEGLLALKDYFAQFIDPNSKISKQWQEDRKMLEQEQLPFFGLISHDTWSNEIEEIIPFGLIANTSEIKTALQDAIQKGIRDAKVIINNQEYPINLTNAHFAFKDKTQRVKHPKKRYYEYDLFANVFSHIKTAINHLNQLHFYQDGMDMYTHFTSFGLPMCLPQLTNSKKLVIDVQDFYPFFDNINPSKYVLNSLRLDHTQPVGFVTGLNSGGKSTLLRSIGCITEIARSGLPVPARYAEISNVEDVVYQETVRDNYQDNLSTFRNQTRTIAELIKYLPKNPRELLLLNEPLPGTDNETETAAMLDILKVLAQLYHIPTLVESHCISAGYAVQEDPIKYKGIKLLKFQMDPNTDTPDYILRTGVGKSEGSYVLEEEGLTFTELQRAFKKKK